MTRGSDLAHRWNVAASMSGYAGSEYNDEPERVFTEVRELRNKWHRVMKENSRLRRELEARS